MNIFIFDDDAVLQMDDFRAICKRYDSDSNEFTIRIEFKNGDCYEPGYEGEVERDKYFDRLVEFLMSLVRLDRQLEKDTINMQKSVDPRTIF